MYVITTVESTLDEPNSFSRPAPQSPFPPPIPLPSPPLPSPPSPPPYPPTPTPRPQNQTSDAGKWPGNDHEAMHRLHQSVASPRAFSYFGPWPSATHHPPPMPPSPIDYRMCQNGPDTALAIPVTPFSFIWDSNNGTSKCMGK